MILVRRERYAHRQLEAKAYRHVPCRDISFIVEDIDGNSAGNSGCGRSYRFETYHLTFSIQMLIRILIE